MGRVNELGEIDARSSTGVIAEVVATPKLAMRIESALSHIVLQNSTLLRAFPCFDSGKSCKYEESVGRVNEVGKNVISWHAYRGI